MDSEDENCVRSNPEKDSLVTIKPYSYGSYAEFLYYDGTA